MSVGFINGALEASGGVVAVQRVTNSIVAALTSTSTIPFDDTIPQIGEGDQAMTVTITPTSASNEIRINVHAFVESSASSGVLMAIFRQGQANALVGSLFGAPNAAGVASVIAFDAPATTSATTYEIRFGSFDGSQVGFNGRNSGVHNFGAAGLAWIEAEEFIP